jgi:hypothetical protein
MILKDASAFNIQFVRGKPVHIDTLSFDFYREGSPWIAYRQFCTHFLAPLAIMRRNHLELGKTFRVFLDGIPLQMAAKMLRLRDKVNPGLVFHILLHARMEKRFGGITKVKRRKTFSSKAMRGLCDSLTSSVEGLKIPRLNTEWGAYYCDTNYTEDGLLEKERIVREFSNLNRVGSIWDLGANNGFYTRVAMKRGYGVAFDMDHSAVEDNYAETKKNGENITPLWMDLTNPSPCLGWASKERKSLTERGGAEMCLALALIHHLCISNNVPLEEVASFLAGICRHLIIEFVPINDSQVKRLLVTRKMIFHDYTESNFVGSFEKHFFIEKADRVKDSLRTIYFMRRK